MTLIPASTQKRCVVSVRWIQLVLQLSARSSGVFKFAFFAVAVFGLSLGLAMQQKTSTKYKRLSAEYSDVIEFKCSEDALRKGVVLHCVAMDKDLLTYNGRGWAAVAALRS